MIPNPSSAAEVELLVGAARAGTSEPLGVSFLVPFVVPEAVEAAAGAADVVEFSHGDPDPKLVQAGKAGGAVLGWQVGSAAEAISAVDAGCNYVVAQGIEAGGHVRGRQALDDVLREPLLAVDVPVVAAGGIGSAARVAALLEAGAAGVRVGTRFVAADEADAHPEYVAKLIAGSRRDTLITEAFSVGWPGAPHRVLRSAVEAAARLDRPVAATLGEREIPRFASTPPTRGTRGEIAAMALYAGESVDAVVRIQPAAEIVGELTVQL